MAQDYGIYNNIVAMNFGIQQERAQVLADIRAGLFRQNEPAAVNAQWNVVNKLRTAALAQGKAKADISKEMRKGEASYRDTMIQAQARVQAAITSASATVTSAKMGLDQQSMRYHQALGQSVMRQIDSTSGKLMNAFKDKNVVPDTGESTEQALTRSLKAQINAIYDLPTDRIQRAYFLEQLHKDIRNVIDAQETWVDENGQRIGRPDNMATAAEVIFNTQGGSPVWGIDYGVGKDGQEVTSRLITNQVEQDRAAQKGGVIGAGGNFDYDRALRLGQTYDNDNEFARSISSAIFNKLQIENPEALGEMKTSEALHAFLYNIENQDDPLYEVIYSAGRDIGNNVIALQSYNDPTWVAAALQEKDLNKQAKLLQANLEKQQRKSVAQINAEADRMFIDMYGTRMQRNIQDRQDQLKKHFKSDPFFSMALGDQKRTIDAMPIDRATKREIKRILVGKSGLLSGNERLEAFDKLQSLLDTQRDRQLRIPSDVQQNLAKQLHSRGMSVIENGEIVGYQIGNEIVPTGQLTYEDLTGLVSMMAKDGGALDTEIEELNKGLSLVKQSALNKNMSEVEMQGLSALRDLAQQLGDAAIDPSQAFNPDDFEFINVDEYTPSVFSMAEGDMDFTAFDSDDFELINLEQFTPTVTENIVLDEPFQYQGVSDEELSDTGRMTDDQKVQAIQNRWDQRLENETDAQPFELAQPTDPFALPDQEDEFAPSDFSIDEDLVALERGRQSFEPVPSESQMPPASPTPFTPAPSQSQPPTGAAPTAFAPTPSQSQVPVRSSDFTPQVAQSTAPTSDRAAFEPTLRPADIEALALKEEQTGGKPNGAAVSEASDEEAKIAADYVTAATATATKETGETVTDEDKQEIAVGVIKPLTGNKPQASVEKNKETIQALAALDEDMTDEDVRDNMRALFGEEFDNNEQVRQQAMLMYGSFVNG